MVARIYGQHANMFIPRPSQQKKTQGCAPPGDRKKLLQKKESNGERYYSF